MRKKKARSQKPTRSPLQRAPAQNADRLQTVESSDQLDSELMNTLQVGVIIHGPGTQILFSNPKALEMLGLTQDQLHGKTSLDPDWNVIHEDGTPFPGDTHPSTQAARTLKPVRDVVMGAYHRGTADRVWLQVNATPQLNADGSLRQVIVTFADISSQKKAEHALREKEERLRLVLQGGDLGVWDWNLTTGRAVVNRRWLSIYGLDPDAPAPTFEQWQAMLHPDDRLMLQLYFAQVMKDRSGAEFQFEFRARHTEGQFIWVHGRGAVVERAPDGRPVRIAGTDMDVTERKQLAELQRLSHERLNAMINNLPVPIATIDGEAVNFVNAAFVQTFGYQRHEIPTVNDWWINAYPDPEYRQKLSVRWSAELARLQKTGEQFAPIEVIITCKNGTTKTVLASVAAFTNTPGAERIVAFYDISQRKRDELALRESEQRLQLALRGGDLGLWDFDPVTDRIFVNDRWLSRFGLDPHQTTITSRDWHAMVHPDDKAELDRLIAQTFNNPAGVDFEMELRARHRDGHYVWVLSKAAVIERAADGRPLRVVGTHMDISERKGLEEAQRRDRERWSAMINSSPVPLAMNDEKGNITFLNPSFVQTFGYRREDIPTLADWWRKAYPDPDYRQEIIAGWQAQIERVARTGEPFSPMEGSLRCKDGTYRTVLASAAAFPESAEGEHVVILYDITEHKRAQALQHENERFLLDAIERFPGMLSYWGRDLRCRAGNAPYRQWFGRTEEQMRGVHQAELLGEDIFDKNKPFLNAVLSGENQQFERTVEKPDGTIGNVLVHYVAHKSNGEIPGFFVFVTDVTSIRRDQEQLRTADIALNSISQGVIIADKEQNITWTNRAFSLITGYIQAEVLGRNCGFLQGPQTDPKTINAIRSALREARDFTGEILNYRKDGTPFWNDLTISPIQGEGSQLNHFIAVQRDITERKQAQKHKARLEAELQQAQKLESVGRLAGGIAHDFNNMLTVILGHAEIAATGPDLAPPVREAIDEIHKAAMRSAELTRNLLAFARRQTIAPRVLDLNLSISGMRTLLQRLVGPQIDLVWGLNADPALVRLDPSQIDQIVINLCVNAKDAMSAGGRITIETANRTFEEDSASRPDNSLLGSYVSLAITDTGCGMDPQTQTHIFEPFFTTKEVGKGTGLGLATVYGAVTQNGGFIDLVSSPGRGTTFTLYLPLQKD